MQCFHVLFFATILGGGAMQRPPHIVLFLTDDQDVELFGMDPMIRTRQLLAERGATFSHAFVTTPICCPSRSSILSGRYAHNHGTRNNSVGGGCSSLYWQRHIEPFSLAPLMHAAGYTTFYAGKYLNRYGDRRVGGAQHVPPGWHHWYGLVGNSKYYNYTLSVNGSEEKHGDKPDDYLTTVIKRRAVEFLDSRASDDAPVFMVLATPAPHAPFTYEARFAHVYGNVSAPRLPNYDVHSAGKHWLVRDMPHPMSADVVTAVDELYRNRWRTLLSVDELVADVIQHMESLAMANDTYFIYTSDNGYHTGQFSMPFDKRQLYEFDVRVPLLLRGGDIAAQTVERQAALNIDIVPTILALANVTAPDYMDGRSLLPLLRRTNGSEESGAWRDHFLIEYWGETNVGIPEECAHLRGGGVAHCYIDCICQDARNNTYACARRLADRRDDVYCEFADDVGTLEYYRLKRDPSQLRNQADQLSPAKAKRLHKLVRKLMRCRARSCP